MMAWGIECSKWDDSVDYANMEAFGYGDVPDESFVVTTWHEDEPLEEVFWFAQRAAKHQIEEIRTTVIIDISLQVRRDELIGKFVRAADLFE